MLEKQLRIWKIHLHSDEKMSPGDVELSHFCSDHRTISLIHVIFYRLTKEIFYIKFEKVSAEDIELPFMYKGSKNSITIQCRLYQNNFISRLIFCWCHSGNL